MGPVSGIYWSAVTALYLFVSFLTGRWDRTRIVWACAGVLFRSPSVSPGWYSRKNKDTCPFPERDPRPSLKGNQTRLILSAYGTRFSKERVCTRICSSGFPQCRKQNVENAPALDECARELQRFANFSRKQKAGLSLFNCSKGVLETPSLPGSAGKSVVSLSRNE